jgi:methyl-accepting chemotaxis protein
MKFLKNLKIGQKLIFSFLLVAFLIGIVGYVGIVNMREINANVRNMYQLDLKGVSNINKIKANLLTIRANILLILDETNHASIDKYQSEINSMVKQNDNLIEDYSKTIITPENRKYYDEFTTLLKQYRIERDRLTNLAKDNDYANAKLLLPEVTKIREDMQVILDKLVELNESLSYNSYIKSEALFKLSLEIIIAIISGGVILAVILGFVITTTISSQVKKVLRFADALKNGDLSQNILIDTTDELGKLGEALNSAKDTMRNLISEILNSSENISASSEELSATIEEISSKMEIINLSTKEISTGAEGLSAASEEVNASVEEIDAATKELYYKSEKSSSSTLEIKSRATEVKDRGIEAIENSRSILQDKQSNILNAIEAGKVVEQITSMADTIGSVAKQINLLALNAAIEAARAGEHGKGFAVVAGEVRKLAEESSETVLNIQNVILQVKSAFSNLSENAQGLLSYIEDNVNPDYRLLIETADHYEKDSQLISNMAAEVTSAANSMKNSLSQVSAAIENITATTEESASSSNEILSSVTETTLAIEEVAKSAQDQAELAEKLNLLIQTFKI